MSKKDKARLAAELAVAILIVLLDSSKEDVSTLSG